MGYCTDFDIVHASSKVIHNLEEVSGYKFYDDSLLSAKWYNFEKDVIKVSLMLPNEHIVIDGRGEDSGDIWRAYASNGTFEKCFAQVKYPTLQKFGYEC